MKAAAARLRADSQTMEPDARAEAARGDRAPAPAGGRAPDSGAKPQAAKRPFVVRAGARLRRGLDPFLSHHSKVGDAPFLDNSHFPWIRELEANWEIVRDEALEMMRYREAIPPLNEISPDTRIWPVRANGGPSSCGAMARRSRPIARAVPGRPR